MAKLTFTITAMQVADIPCAAQIAADSFHRDRHTEMKSHGQEPYDHLQTMLDILPGFLSHPKLACLKAIDDRTGQTIGFCIWGFRGFEPQEMPSLPGRQTPGERPTMEESRKESVMETEEETQQENHNQEDPIKRLSTMTDADMAAWVEEVMPPGVRCLYVVMLSVSPDFQGQGVGSSLLNWGITCCEKHEVFAWVHSSESAHGMYAKLGFLTIRSLDIDLDEYAPCPPPGEGPNARWGHYVFRYMKYMPGRAD